MKIIAIERLPIYFVTSENDELYRSITKVHIEISSCYKHALLNEISISGIKENINLNKFDQDFICWFLKNSSSLKKRLNLILILKLMLYLLIHIIQVLNVFFFLSTYLSKNQWLNKRSVVRASSRIIIYQIVFLYKCHKKHNQAQPNYHEKNEQFWQFFLYRYNYGNLTLYNCIFNSIGNENYIGGSIYLHCNILNKLTKCIFNSCWSLNGGAIYLNIF